MTHPSTDYYSLGRGVLSMAKWSGGSPGSYVDVGNCPDLQVNLDEQQLEHFSSRSGLRTKDKVVTLEVGFSLAITLDEISKENLAKFLRGSISGQSIYGLQATSDRYAIKFVEDKPAGKNFTWVFHKCKLTPASAMNLISDDWSTIQLTAEGESDTANNPASPYFTATLMTTTTTSTTTSTT